MIRNRDVLSISINEEEELILASDCSGGVGRKHADEVQADPEVVGYFSFRVAVMECLAVGARLVAVQLFNFTSDTVWDKYTQGVRMGLKELGMEGVPLTGSSESNINLKQSALGVTCIGMRKKKRDQTSKKGISYALIGTPLVGDEVLRSQSYIAPLSLFKECILHPAIIHILPVGSKGVRHELSVLTEKTLRKEDVHSFQDLEKSSGPATSFIISFEAKDETVIKEMTAGYYQPLQLYY